MTNTPVDPVVEILIDGTWVDFTDRVRLSSADSGGGIKIDRGRANEASQMEPTQIQLTLNNASGILSPGNATGPYYGLLKRNLPIRIGLRRQTDNFGRTSVNSWGNTDTGQAWRITGTAANFDVAAGVGTLQAATGHQMATTSTPYADVNVEAKFKVSNLTSEVGVVFRVDPTNPAWMSCYFTPGTPDQWRFGMVHTSGGVAQATGLDGTFEIVANTYYRIQAQARGQRFRFRIWPDGEQPPQWRLWYYQPIDTEDVETPPSVGEVGVFAKDGTALVTWDEIVITNYRAHGEITKLPPRWDLSRQDRWVPILATGVTRRMGQGSKALDSAMTHHLRQFLSYGWWTLETGDPDAGVVPATNEGGAQAIAPGVTFSTDDTLPGSAGVAFVESATDRFSFQIKNHATTGAETLLWFFKIPTPPGGDSTPFIISSTGTARTWQVQINAGSGVTVYARDGQSTLLDSKTSLLWFGSDMPAGIWIACTLYLFQNGGNVNWAWNFHRPGSALFYTLNGVYAGTVGRFTGGTFSGTAATELVGGLYLAQILHYPGDLPFVTDSFARAAVAYDGELTTERFNRMMTDAAILYSTIGATVSGHPMGLQLPSPLLDILQDTAEVEDGMLMEDRDSIGLQIRTRPSLYNQRILELDIDEGHLSAPLEPTPDDQLTRNYVAVSRPRGGTATSIQTTGPLNINQPDEDDDGVGVYDEGPEINFSTVSQLQPAADWRRYRGTNDESRYPSVHVDLTAEVYQNDLALTAWVSDLDSGDMVALINSEVSADRTVQMVQQTSETIDQYDWDINFVTTPARQYQVGAVGYSTRVQPAGSVTAASFIAGTNTALSVQRIDSTYGPWTRTVDDASAADFDIMVDGVRLHVVSIAGTADPQTITVSAAPVNGVIKTIAAGKPVKLYQPWRVSWG